MALGPNGGPLAPLLNPAPNAAPNPALGGHMVGPPAIPATIHGFGPHGAVTYTAPNPAAQTLGPTLGPSGLPIPPPSLPAPPGWVSGISEGKTPTPITDEHNTGNVISHLIASLQAARDPQLRESLSMALAAMHKHLANFQKERQQALAGKLSPRLLEQAHGTAIAHVAHSATGHIAPAMELANMGNYAGAAQEWIARHPYAMAHGNIPGYVTHWETLAHSNAPASGMTAQ